LVSKYFINDHISEMIKNINACGGNLYNLRFSFDEYKVLLKNNDKLLADLIGISVYNNVFTRLVIKEKGLI